MKRFETTRWSLVIAAQRDRSEARAALAELCEAYWYPLYAYVRRWGRDADAAQDLTQAFFALLLERQDFKMANPQRGRLRSFLLTSLKHFLVNEAEAARAIKRGAGRSPVPLGLDGAERRYRREPIDTRTPEAVFDRKWALTVLHRVLARLRREAIESNTQRTFDELKPALTGEPLAGGYAAAGRRLKMSEGAIKVAVHRLRRRFRTMLRAEIASTVDTEAAITEELSYLLDTLRG